MARGLCGAATGTYLEESDTLHVVQPGQGQCRSSQWSAKGQPSAGAENVEAAEARMGTARYSQSMRSRAVIRRGLRSLALASLYSHRAPNDPVFVVAPMPRSGSTLLVSYLNSLPGVTVAGEPLNHQSSIGIRRTLITKKRVIRHIAGTIGHLDGTVRGAKLLGPQLDERSISLGDLRLRFPESRLVVSYRQSIFEQYVSLRVAQETRQWTTVHAFAGRIFISPNKFAVFVENHHRRHEQILSNAPGKLVISYEELVDDPQSAFGDKICPHIGMPFSPVTTAMTKRVTKPMSEVVANWDEVSHLAELRVMY